MLDKTSLQIELNTTLESIDAQIESLGRIAKRWGAGVESDVHSLQNTKGELMLSPLLIAKTQVLCALVDLEKIE